MVTVFHIVDWLIPRNSFPINHLWSPINHQSFVGGFFGQDCYNNGGLLLLCDQARGRNCVFFWMKVDVTLSCVLERRTGKMVLEISW